MSTEVKIIFIHTCRSLLLQKLRHTSQAVQWFLSSVELFRSTFFPIRNIWRGEREQMMSGLPMNASPQVGESNSSLEAPN